MSRRGGESRRRRRRGRRREDLRRGNGRARGSDLSFPLSAAPPTPPPPRPGKADDPVKLIDPLKSQDGARRPETEISLQPGAHSNGSDGSARRPFFFIINEGNHFLDFPYFPAPPPPRRQAHRRRGTTHCPPPLAFSASFPLWPHGNHHNSHPSILSLSLPS